MQVDINNEEIITEKKINATLFMVFIGFIIFWIVATSLEYRNIWFIMFSIVSIILIVNNIATIKKQDIIIGVILGILSIPSEPFMGLSTIIAYIAGMSVFNKSKNKIELIKQGKKNVLISLVILLITGIGLGILNYFVASYEMTINISFRIEWILDALKAGIGEEVLFRFLLYAICIQLSRDINLNKWQTFMCYLIMIIPHTLAHFNFATFSITNVVFPSLFFGLPFTLLLIKRDLLTAVGSHTIVDLIRFIIFGI